MIFKLELSPQNFHYDVLYPLYSAVTYIYIQEKFSFWTNSMISVNLMLERNWRSPSGLPEAAQCG